LDSSTWVGGTTSWLANTFAGGNIGDPSMPHVQHSLSGAAVTADGSVVTNTNWDEGYRKSEIYKDGQIVTYMESLNPRIPVAGVAVAVDGTYVYQSVNRGSVARFFRSSGQPAPFPGGASNGGNWINVTNSALVVGVAVTSSELYVSTRDNIVKVYDKSSLSLVRQFSTAAGVDKIAVDGSGTVFAIQGNDYIAKYSSTGTALGTITSIGHPTAIALENSGSHRLMVFDDDSSQQIKYFDPSSLASAGTFGVAGGMLADPKGVPGPTRFLGVMGLGTDASGNVYVAMNVSGTALPNSSDPSTPWNDGEADPGGTVIRSVTPSGQQRWEVTGLAFVDSAVFDPTDENVVYTARDKFRLDLSKPAGQQWSWVAHTVDKVRFPGDSRLFNHNSSATSPMVFVAGGQKYMAVAGMYEGGLAFYRQEGEIWVPAGGMGVSGWGISFDANGNLWTAPGNIEKRTLTGLDGAGNLTWSAPSSYPKPADFTSVERLQYEPSTDTMYLFGYTPSLPDNLQGCSFGMVGRSAARYDNWSSSPAKRWQNQLNEQVVCNHDGPDGARAAKAVAVTQDYIFAADLARTNENGPLTRMYRTSDGSFVENIQPGPEVNNWMGLIDLPYGISAVRRSNGEYNVLSEEDGSGKILHYRLAGGSALANLPPVVGLTQPLAGSVAAAPATINLAATASDSDGNVAKVEFFDGSTKIGEAASSPYSLQWSGVPAGTHTLTARATDNLGATTSSSPVDILVSPAAPTHDVTPPSWSDGTAPIPRQSLGQPARKKVCRQVLRRVRQRYRYRDRRGRLRTGFRWSRRYVKVCK
jgi:hypothetical protein